MRSGVRPDTRRRQAASSRDQPPRAWLLAVLSGSAGRREGHPWTKPTQTPRGRRKKLLDARGRRKSSRASSVAASLTITRVATVPLSHPRKGFTKRALPSSPAVASTARREPPEHRNATSHPTIRRGAARGCSGSCIPSGQRPIARRASTPASLPKTAPRGKRAREVAGPQAVPCHRCRSGRPAGCRRIRHPNRRDGRSPRMTTIPQIGRARRAGSGFLVSTRAIPSASFASFSHTIRPHSASESSSPAQGKIMTAASLASVSQTPCGSPADAADVQARQTIGAADEPTTPTLFIQPIPRRTEAAWRRRRQREGGDRCLARYCRKVAQCALGPQAVSSGASPASALAGVCRA